MNLRKFFVVDKTDTGITSPSDYTYMKTLRAMLAFIGSWPRREIGEYESKFMTIFQKGFYILLCILCVTGQGLYIFFHSSTTDFLDLGHLYIVLFMTSVDISRILTLTFTTRYRDVGKEFLRKMHLFYYKERSDFAMKTHRQVHKMSHYLTIGLTIQMGFGLTFFNLIPMYTNYAAGNYKPGGVLNSTFEHSLYMAYPFNTSTDMTGYIIVCIFHWFASYLTATWFCMFDLFLSLMVFNVWGHLKILLNKLNTFPKPSTKSSMILDGINISTEMYSKEEQQQMFDMLNDCIDYHREIIKFTDQMSTVFGPMLLVYYIFHQVSGCLLLLECSQMTAQALMRFLPLTIILFQQLIQLSIIFELVGTQSEKLKDAVYSVPWECMDTRNRKIVAFFLMNVQEPVHVKAMGVADVGVTSMAAILRTSLSYFTFLRSM